MKVVVAAVQQPLHEPVSSDYKQKILEAGVDFVCLPEHYPLAADIRNLQQAAERFEERKAYLAQLSAELRTIVIGGTLTEKTDHGFYNTCYVFDGGKEVGYYRKVNPTPREMQAGILKGEEFKVFLLQGVRVGVLICADVLSLHSFEQLAALQCRLAFVPTASPYRPGESVEEKYERDRTIFLEGAGRLRCPIIKTCGVGTVFGQPVQGRSLIAVPDRILLRATPEQEHEPLLLIAGLTLI